MAPFSLIMPEVPDHITDGEIAGQWKVCGYHYIRSIQMEPFVENGRRCQRVTIHFDDFSNSELREQIVSGYYKTNLYNLRWAIAGNYILESSYLLPCETPQPPRTEYSHVVALQLQDVVRQQAEQIRLLEAQLQLHKEYNNDIHDMIIALEAKHEAENKLQAEKNEELNHKLAAVIEWCSQPVWRRKFAAFISPK